MSWRGWALVVSLLSAAGSAGGQTPMACPDSNSLTRDVDREIGALHATWKLKPAAPVPPACVYTALARAPLAHSDSAIIQGLDLSAEHLRRTPGDVAVLEARVTLLYRAERYREVGPAIDELFSASPSRMTEDVYRMSIASAMRLHDTVATINRLANASYRYSRRFTPEYDVWRQLPRLRALIDSVHRRLNADPTLVVGYVNLSSIYGNLDRPDSAIAFAKLALKKGVGREAVGKALESLIGVRMRRARILATPDVWAATLPVALAVDSALTTPASKYLVALTLSEIVADEARLAQQIAYGIESGEPGGFGRLTVRGDGARVRVLTCGRIAELEGMIAMSRAKLHAGGDQFAPETMQGMRAGLTAMSATFTSLKQRCTA
jgi:hypothetical protein